MTDEIERLSVVLEANADKLVTDTTKVVKELETQLQGMGDKGEEAFDKTGAAAQKAAGYYRDAAGRIRDANGRFVKMGSEGAEAFRKTEEAAKGAGEEFGKIPPQVDAIKKALETVAKSGKFAVEQIDEETKELNQALKLLGKTGEFEIKKIEKSSEGFITRLQSMSAGVVAAYGAITGVFAGAIAAVKQLTDANIEAAQSQFNLSASIQAANKEFGTSIGTQNSWRKNLEEMGQELSTFSNKDVSDATSRLIDMTKRLGLTEEQMKVVLSRTADLAAGKVDLSGGVERVSAALRGEAESAEYLGLTLSEGAVRQYTEEQGLVFKELSDGEKVQLRYQLLLEQTNDAQGRAAAFAETAAGQQAALNAQLENQAVILGEQLMPLREGYAELLGLFSMETEENASIISKVLAGIAASFITLGVSATMAINNIKGQAGILAETYSGLWQAISSGNLSGLGEFWQQQQAKMDEFVNTHSLEAAGGFTGIWSDAFGQVLEGWEQQRAQTDINLPGDDSMGGPTAEDATGGDALTEEMREILLDRFEELAELQDDINKQSEEEAERHNEELLEIEEEFADKRTDAAADLAEDLADLEKDSTKKRTEAAKDLADELADLEQETADKRADIFADSKKELEELEAETDQAIAEKRDEFETEELRATEDHLDELRRLRDQYILDLEGATAARDARAIVDLRKKYEQEQAETESAFRTDQAREEEDFNQELLDLQENERAKADEILRNQAEELADLALHEDRKQQELQQSYDEKIAEINASEAEKRAELQADYQQELADIATAEAEKIAQENERNAERQTQLEESIAQRLETIATGLASEKDVNEEGAAAILETLANYFGEDGEIDALMKAFEDRVSARIEIETNITTNRSEGSSSSSSAPRASGSSSGRVFQHGTGPEGELFTKPTQITVAEGGSPELVTVTPFHSIQNAMASSVSSFAPAVRSGETASQSLSSAPQEVDLTVRLSGSAPPGINNGADRDAIAGTLVDALRQAGFRAKSG